MELIIERLSYELTVCQVESLADANVGSGFFFIGSTDEEVSLVCETGDVPASTIAREDGWKAFRAKGVLDFSLVGILSGLSNVLAQAGVSIFALSTYNTDYVLVKAADFDRAADALARAGYRIVDGR